MQYPVGGDEGGARVLRHRGALRHHLPHHRRVHRLRADCAQPHAAARQRRRRGAHKVRQRCLAGRIDGRDGHLLGASRYQKGGP